jgi:hypothetical protein
MVTQEIGTAAVATSGFSTGGARDWGASQRKALSVQVLARTEPVTQLAALHQVSRKFLYQQASRASAALDDAFEQPQDDQAVLFHLPVTRGWIRQFIVGLALEGHSSFRGIRQLAADLLDWPVSLGTIHNVIAAAGEQARTIHAAEDLSAIRVGAHDEIYQAGRPVLVGLDPKTRPEPLPETACLTPSTACRQPPTATPSVETVTPSRLVLNHAEKGVSRRFWAGRVPTRAAPAGWRRSPKPVFRYGLTKRPAGVIRGCHKCFLAKARPDNSPEVPVGKCVAGALLEVQLEFFGFATVGEVDGDDNFPRGVLAGVWRSSGIMIGNAFLQIAGQADVTLFGVGS